MAYFIKKLEISDLSDIQMILSSHEESGGWPASDSWIPEKLKGELEKAEGLILCSPPEEPQAFMLYRTLPGAIEVTLIASSKKSSGQGFAKALIERLLSELPENEEAWLEVHEANGRAQGFYEKLGFKRNGLRSKYYPDGRDAYLYSFKN